jgi:hypothetical protein
LLFVVWAGHRGKASNLKIPVLVLVVAAMVVEVSVLAENIPQDTTADTYPLPTSIETAGDLYLQPNVGGQASASSTADTGSEALSWPRTQVQDLQTIEEPRTYYDDKQGRRVDEVVPRAIDNVNGLRDISHGDRQTYANVGPVTPDIALSREAPVAQTRVSFNLLSSVWARGQAVTVILPCLFVI